MSIQEATVTLVLLLQILIYKHIFQYTVILKRKDKVLLSTLSVQHKKCTAVTVHSFTLSDYQFTGIIQIIKWDYIMTTVHHPALPPFHHGR